MFHPILDVVIGLVLYLTFFYPTTFKWCPFIIYFSGNAAKTILENYEKVIDLPMILALLVQRHSERTTAEGKL